LIRVQIELARGAPHERAQFLAARDRELEPAVATAWQERIRVPGPGNWRNWARGFPLALKGFCPWPADTPFAQAAPVPLREVEVTDAADYELANFLTWPGLRLVRELDVWANGYVRDDLLALAGCEHLGHLERLRMEGVVLTDEAAVALIESRYLTRLGYLRLWRCRNYLSWGVGTRFRARFADWNQ
jgi:hypothetical protein